jgi:predicted dehydrogenase
MNPVRVGIVGCGNIVGIYLENNAWLQDFEVVACADLIRKRSTENAKKFDIPKVCTTKQLLADKSIDLVLNLTNPQAHLEVSMAALNAGKHVYSEKPLGLTRKEGQTILDLAKKKGLLVGGAPDTVLGAGIQTCRKLIDDGWIGEPVAATAFMQCHGHESWHPDPAFYYHEGGGPMFDMGPYYLTALVTLMGAVKRVSGSARITFDKRTITSEPKRGDTIHVEVPTHVAGTLDFQCGAIATIVTSFDVWAHHNPCIEIHGTTGSLCVPDPNTFGGPVKLFRPGAEAWTDIPLTHGYKENSRGLGVADMACAIRSGRGHRLSGALTYHVLDIMQALHEASSKGKHVNLRSKYKRSAAMPMDLVSGTVDQ